MQSLLKFDKMVTPSIIQVIYYLGLIIVAVSGIWSIAAGMFLQGIGIIVLGAIGVRVYSELLILWFRIYEKLSEINDNLNNKN